MMGTPRAARQSMRRRHSTSVDGPWAPPRGSECAEGASRGLARHVPALARQPHKGRHRTWPAKTHCRLRACRGVSSADGVLGRVGHVQRAGHDGAKGTDSGAAGTNAPDKRGELVPMASEGAVGALSGVGRTPRICWYVCTLAASAPVNVFLRSAGCQKGGLTSPAIGGCAADSTTREFDRPRLLKCVIN